MPLEKEHTYHIHFEESGYQPILQIVSELKILVLSKCSKYILSKIFQYSYIVLPVLS
jgi:hypothetical protein